MAKKKNEPAKSVPAFIDEDDAPSTQPLVPPAAASPEPAEAIPPAPPAPPAPSAPAGPAVKHLRYRVLTGRVVSLDGQIQAVTAGTIVTEDGYGGAAGIQRLKDAGLDLELCE